MSASWASATAFSPEWPAKRPVGAADFTLEPGGAQPSRGEYNSFLSPLKPRGLLLSVMRQKVGKERSQEGCAPLANPRFFRTAPPGEGSARRPHPSRLCKTPVGVPSGTDRAGDAEHRNGLAKFSVRSLTAFFLPQPPRRDGRPTPPPYGPDCSWKTAIADRAPLRRPPRRAQLRCCSAGYGAVSEKEPRPTVSGRTLGLFWSPAGISSRLCSRTTSEIPLKAGGRPKTCFDCPTRAAALTPGGRCLPALGIGLTGEKTGFVRALAEIDQTTLGCLVNFLLQQSRGAARHSKAGVGSATSYDCPARAAAQLRLR